MMTLNDLTIAVRDAERWSQAMNEALLKAQQFAKEKITDTPNVCARMRVESSKLATLTMMLTAIIEFKEKLQVAYDSYVEKIKNSKDKAMAERAHQNEVAMAEDALDFLKKAEASGQDTMALGKSMFAFLAKKMVAPEFVAMIDTPADVHSFACFALFTSDVLRDLREHKLNFAIGKHLAEEHYLHICTQMSLITKGSIKVVPGQSYEMSILNNRCMFRQLSNQENETLWATVNKNTTTQTI